MDDHEASQGFLPGTRRSLYATGPRARSEGDHIASDLLQRTQGLFLEIQATHAINVGRAEELVDQVLARLNGAMPVDLRRVYTGLSADIVPAHALLCAALCAHVARCLGWNAESFRGLVLAGLLHDVGMLFLRSDALKAPRLLTEEERAEVHGHTRIGYSLIAGTGSWGEEIALAARDHHERWDGSGYPTGLRAAEVLFPARLVGLLDMYAALLAPRPHRNALDHRTALGKVSRALELGLFDPSFHFLLKGTFRGARIWGFDDPKVSTGLPATLVPGGNSVEIEERLATMLTKGS
jgi:HD-GYP domain-containing protein (c-di-GMP phosphodiesterase class II)